MFYSSVSPSKEMRAAADEASTLVSEYSGEDSVSARIWEAKVAVEKQLKSSGAWDDTLKPEERRLVETMLEGNRGGVARTKEVREERAVLNKELSDLAAEFEVRAGRLISARPISNDNHSPPRKTVSKKRQRSSFLHHATCH